MLLKKLFARKSPRSVAASKSEKPGNFEVALNPIALLVKGATRF
ncbi:MAG: hypothetical protein ACE5H8_08270 [Alphaproteobacteria bacterium]